MLRIRYTLSLLLLGTLAISGCDLIETITGNDDEDDSSGNYTTATLTHEGFDFSTNTAGYSPNYDGETIAWQPGGADNPSFPRDVNLWWRPADMKRTKDMGTVTMSSVTQVPSSWDTSPDIPPLQVGHVYVAECADGYVKFKVNSVDPDGANWPVQVEFSFTNTTTFGP